MKSVSSFTAFKTNIARYGETLTKIITYLCFLRNRIKHCKSNWRYFEQNLEIGFKKNGLRVLSSF